MRRCRAVRAGFAAAFALACGASVSERIDEAQALRDGGRPAEAIALLREVLEREPRNPEANFELGMALAESEQTNLAIVYLQAAEESPEHAAAAGLALARAYLAGVNYEEAVRAATRVLEREPDDVEALALRASAASQIGRFEDALRDADRVLALSPDDPHASSVKASAQMRLGRLDEAERGYRALKERGADGGDVAEAARACTSYANFFSEGRKDPVRAERELDRCAELYPDDPLLVRFALGFYDSAERGEKAVALLRRALEKSPDRLAVRKELARRLAARGEAKAGEAMLREPAERLDSPVAWGNLAAFLRDQRDFAGALVALERAIARTPKALDPLLLSLVDLHVEAKRIEAAEATAAKLELPVYRDFANGRILLAKGDPKGALAALERGLRSWPNHAGARFLAGSAALSLGDTDRALNELIEATRAGAEDTDAALVGANIYFQRGDFDGAIALAARQPASRRAGRLAAMLLGARAEQARGRPEVALRIVDAVLEEFPRDPQALAVRADLVRRQQGAAEAARQLAASGADFTDPANERAIRALAQLRVDQGQLDTALAEIDAALAKHPDAALFHELRGRVLLVRGELAPAKRALERALELDPEFAPAQAALGSLLGRSGDAARGLELLDRAAKREPDQPDHAFQAALLVRSQDRTDDAIARFRAILARSPTHAGSCSELAWLLASRKEELPFALELATRAVRLAASAEFLDTLGFVQLTSGDAAGAVASLERSLKLRPAAPGSRYRLGLALAATGRAAEAEQAFRAALAGGAFAEADDARARLAELERGRATP